MKFHALMLASVFGAVGFAGGPAHALPSPVLPGPISYEYFGLNFLNNVVTSNTVGTLNYTGGPGCGGTCSATTSLGAAPYASLSVNEVVFDNTSGGGAIAKLGYYLEYVNAPGIYNVNLHAISSLPASNIVSTAYAYLAFGPAGTVPGNFNDFGSFALQEADCLLSSGCPIVATGPFVADHLIQMTANIPYFLTMDVEIFPIPNNVSATAFIDPTFSTTAPGGFFAFSQGVFDGSVTSTVPVPPSQSLMILGLAGIGFAGRRRRARA